MQIFTLERSMDLALPQVEVFEFFADARNLEVITPPWLHFRILTPARIFMGIGTRIEYRLRIRGVPVRWVSEIAAWDPPRRFVDKQISGPYRLWEHEHRFEDTASGTKVRDRVRYAVPGGAIVQRLLVAPDLERIFDYRREQLARILGQSELSLASPRDREDPGIP
jgi:ligand-binding SRPBCC domain-containing protein